MKFITTAPDRRTLVKAIAAHTGMEPSYIGPPAFNYTVGTITIDREGYVDVPDEQAIVVGRLATAAARYAQAQGFAEHGYRIVMNCNGDGGQTVFQIHLHLLAGAPLGRFGTPA